MKPKQTRIWKKNVRNAERPLPSGVLEGLCPACLFKQGAAADTAMPPETAPFPPTHEELAAAFPQLEILELIGQGGMGFVFKARQPKIDRLVALKILPPRRWPPTRRSPSGSRAKRRVLAHLNHPNIVAVHEFGQADGLSSTSSWSSWMG